MNDTLTTAPSTRSTTRTARTVARWMVSFAGFPLGGVAAMVLTGPVDTTTAALAGGLVSGAVLGAVQGWAMRADRRFLATWMVATALGLSIGLALGATLVDFGTGLGELAVQGAISGLAVGAAQAIALFPRTGPEVFAWPFYLAATWALGWVVTTSIGVQVDDQFTVFGSAGALTVALLTSVLPVHLHHHTEKSSS